MTINVYEFSTFNPRTNEPVWPSRNITRDVALDTDHIIETYCEAALVVAAVDVRVNVTPGGSAGEVFATDQFIPAGGQFLFHFKPGHGPNPPRIKATAAAGNSNVQSVGGAGDVVTVTLSLDTSAYADGDVHADTQVITNALRIAGGRGILQSITVLDEDDVGQTFDIVLLSTNTSLGTENSAPSITDANARNIIAIGGPSNDLRISSGDYVDVGGSKLCTKTGLGLVVEAASGSRDLYVATIIRGAGTYTASGVRISFGFLWD